MSRQFPGGEKELLLAFTAGKQILYCRDEERAMFGKAPLLGTVRDAYGRNVAESWLELQLKDLSEFAGCREKLTRDRRVELAAQIMCDYPHYRLTELMLFFQRFKRGCYGKFYGTVDPIVINQALGEFDSERNRMIRERRKEEASLRRDPGEVELEAARERYRRCVPGAFTDAAALSFPQYYYGGFHALPDECLQEKLEQLRQGELTAPETFKLS